MAWHIVSDSSCDLHALSGVSPDIHFTTIPFHITVGPRDYVDDGAIDVDAMLKDNETSPEAAHTACPSPQLWAEAFAQPGPVLAFTISSNLSGSYNSACAGRDMILEEEPDKPIAIIDTKATGPETVLLIRKACALIAEGKAIEEIASDLRRMAEATHIIFALASYRNLIKNGRVNRLVGLMAGHLGFWGIGVGDDEGRIAMRGKARGEKRMIHFLLDEIKATGLADKAVVICHCLNEEAAQLLKTALSEAFSGILVDILPTRGLDSFYAERHGLIVAY
ncbi:MAG: DegV family EDD domain-containing protein [Clostridia bacterium]|nr:DegV family EDD domain-containing protein [Clostridia bacterium]